MVHVPVGAECYLCLGEGDDEEGLPLVRDCSCRGDSAGFAHLSCIIHFAEQKSEKVVDHCLCGDPECVANAADIPWEFIEPWNTCIICKQSFQDQLSLDLTSAVYRLRSRNIPEMRRFDYERLKTRDFSS